MSKYDRMVEMNQERSEAKISVAAEAIKKLMENGEKVTVSKLMKMTGLSKGFFYKNVVIRSQISEALDRQVGMVDPRRGILDMAMNNRIELLLQQIAELKRENEMLRAENQKLQKAVKKKSLSVIKNL
ncbi:DUF6262 family protein [Frisingicoccus caecimuris]|nr:DUF6262 family protein [Frisingicoccus caecimuris]MCR1919379.1 DUF6262 family protein [Frisingicoccus caecimuris]